MFSKRQTAFIMILVYLLLFLAVVAFTYYILPNIIIWLIPFILAYFFSAIALPISRLFNKSFKMPIKVSRVVAIILVFAIFGSLIGLLVFKIVSELSAAASQLPDYMQAALDAFKNLPMIIRDFYNVLPPGSSEQVDSFFKNAIDIQSVQQYISNLLFGLGRFVTNIPSFMIFIFFTLIASFFMTIDRDIINDTIRKTLPRRVYLGIFVAFRNFKNAVWGWIKAQLILFVIVFFELLIGFSILKVEYILLLAFLIAFVDAMPVLGVGTVLIPWSLYNIFIKEYRLGLSLLVLYAIMFIVRQIIEPKIVSTQIGLHPLLTLLSMYAGLQVFGFFGMVLAPIFLIIVINLYKAGMFSTVKRADFI